MIEKDDVQIYDIVTSGELENFEDKNGNGTYKAGYGHDDIIMTLVQIPMLMQTPRYKDYIEEYEVSQMSSSINNKWDSNSYYGYPESMSLYGAPTTFSFERAL